MQIPCKLNALTRFIYLALTTTQDQTQIVQLFQTTRPDPFSHCQLNKTHVMCNCKTSQSPVANMLIISHDCNLLPLSSPPRPKMLSYFFICSLLSSALQISEPFFTHVAVAMARGDWVKHACTVCQVHSFEIISKSMWKSITQEHGHFYTNFKLD